MERVNETFLIRVWKLLPNRICFKTVRLMTIRKEPKWIILTSGGFGLLQIILELDIE